MCGIAAIVAADGQDLERQIVAMTHALTHRGPDDFGFEVLPEEGVALGMRRLSILDIEGGRQPMWDEAETCCVVFNGEIYNYRALWDELSRKGHSFSSDHSDTEVLVHGYEEWGLDLFARLNGMFACAIWDRRRRQLVVARDRMGEKPLYYGRIPNGYIIGSELKALFRHPALSREIDLSGLRQYLAYDYTIGEQTLIRDVRKLPPAHYGVITPGGVETGRYWTPNCDPEPITIDEAVAQLDTLLDRSVELRMVADVPVGLFLSGGVDSSTIGYYMTRHSAQVNSFSIGFEEPEYDESAHAEQVSRHLGTNHHTEVFPQARVRDLVSRVAEILDEPMGDVSIFPTHLLSLVTRREVKVALGGDGSDELLMGYDSYRPMKVAWALDWLPLSVRQGVARAARQLPDHVGSKGVRGVKFARRLDQTPADRLLMHFRMTKADPRILLSRETLQSFEGNGSSSSRRAAVLEDVDGNVTAANETIITYLRTYLADDILVKVDRASMAASLEVRSPFLDPDLVDFTFGLPDSMKMRGLTRKYVLRRLMRGRLPDAILDRPKQGFHPPVYAWLRGSLAPLVREYLEPDRVRRAGIFDAHAVSQLVEDHLSGRRNRGLEVWLLLQFELWRDHWLNR